MPNKISFAPTLNHFPSMSFILCLVTTFLITSIHAGHKRVVIRVPQKTKYIHHHTVKKVPIYVLLPEKKPKILEMLEEIKPSTVRPPCKDLYELPTVREDTSTQTRNRYEKTEREKPLSEWTEDTKNRGAYYVNAVDPSYRTIDEDFLLPPPMSFDDVPLPFRRVNSDIEKNPFESRQPRGHEAHRQQSVTNLVTFTYPPPPPTAIQNQEYTSYQYKINH